MYDQIGSPGAPSGRSGAGAGGSDAELSGHGRSRCRSRQRLDCQYPEDIAGWKMLGRTQMTMQQFGGAVDAL